MERTCPSESFPFLRGVFVIRSYSHTRKNLLHNVHHIFFLLKVGQFFPESAHTWMVVLPGLCKETAKHILYLLFYSMFCVEQKIVHVGAEKNIHAILITSLH